MHHRAAPLLAILVMGGCGKAGDQATAGRAVSSITPTDAGSVGYSESGPPAADQAKQGEPAPTAPGPGTAPSAAVTDTAAPRMIIRNGSATVKVDKLEPAIAAVQQLARRLGGYVANSSLQSGSENTREATLEVKLPSARWDQAIAGLRPVGKLEAQETTTEDVGEEYVDVTARMANARRLEQRLVELLATRTGKLEDVLAVERELARVREEIERYEGRLRYLRSRVALSTLTVKLHEPYPLVGAHAGDNPILNAFSQAWRNFVNFLAGLIAALGWLLPLAVVAAAFLWVVIRVMRWMTGRGHPGGAPMPPHRPYSPPSTPPGGSGPGDPPHA